MQRFDGVPACCGTDYDGKIDTSHDDIWFPRQKSHGPSAQRRLERAREICATCPVIEQCFESALTEDERHSIRAGVDFGAEYMKGWNRGKRARSLRYHFKKFLAER